MEYSTLPDAGATLLTPPVGIVCHDAGGANQILAMCAADDFSDAKAYFEGPALVSWSKSPAVVSLTASLEALLPASKTLITGTGWASSLEHNARIAARKLGIRSIAVLDHWTNYRERFIRDDSEILPDELWVVDDYAMKIAHRTFPALPIRRREDRYAEEETRRILPVSAIDGNELLYLLEPARSDWGGSESGEYQALRYFIACLPQLGLPTDTTIRLRPHPSDPPGKYDAFYDAGDTWQVLPSVGNLTEALSKAIWVAGCQTYALTLALKAGRTVYCSLPPWAPSCMLPHAGLIHLKDIAIT